ncbi:MAG: zinc-binding alcohol dehydrogenase family protein [Alphaproteobacteria bacterium]
MKAVALYRYLPIDDPEAFLDVEIPTPAAVGRDLLVEVKAVSVNPVDCKTRAPKAQVETAPRVLGWDAAGVVKAAGGDATLFKPGDAVYYAGSIARPGCDSEFHLVDERIVGRKPANLGFAEASALPLTTITAWEALFDRLGVPRRGGAAAGAETVLVIGGAGGVGSIAIQLAKKLAGLKVIATASRPESVKWVQALGADAVADHSKDLAAELKALGTPEVEYVLCFNDLDRHFPAFAQIVKPQGKICAIVRPAAPLELGPLMAKSVTFAWEMMFTRAMFETPDMIAQHELLDEAAGLIEAGVLKTTLARNMGTLNAANLKRAHKALEEGHTIGKLVLEGF